MPHITKAYKIESEYARDYVAAALADLYAQGSEAIAQEYGDPLKATAFFAMVISN